MKFGRQPQIVQVGRRPQFCKAVLRSLLVALLMSESKLIQIPAISLLVRSGWGWVAGGIGNNANLAQLG